MRQTLLAAIACVGPGVLGVVPQAFADVTFREVGVLGSSFRAESISADGRIVAGSVGNFSGGSGSFWTADGGIENLGFSVISTPSHFYPRVVISPDGGSVTAMNGDRLAFRWNETDGSYVIPMGGQIPHALGVAISANGSTVLGYDFHGGLGAFVWTEADGAQSIGSPPDGPFVLGFGLSADGSSAVVTAAVSVPVNRVYRWSAAMGFEDTGIVTYVRQGGNTLAISGDGRTVAASARTSLTAPGPLHVWREGAGTQEIGMLPGDLWAEPFAMSHDGSVIVGASQTFSVSHAFLWREDLGMIDIRSYVESFGVDMTDWLLTRATGVSADGETIVGIGQFRRNGLWHDRSWMVTIPAPAGAGICAVAMIGLAARRRRA